MSILRKITFFRIYLLFCILAASVYSYAEYYGYELLGSDESPGSRIHGGTIGGSSVHHK